MKEMAAWARECARAPRAAEFDRWRAIFGVFTRCRRAGGSGRAARGPGGLGPRPPTPSKSHPVFRRANRMKRYKRFQRALGNATLASLGITAVGGGAVEVK